VRNGEDENARPEFNVDAKAVLFIHHSIITLLGNLMKKMEFIDLASPAIRKMGR
jgi:hypothetical protein